MFTKKNVANLYSKVLSNDGFSTNHKNESPVTGFMVSLPDYETIVPADLLTFDLFKSIYNVYVKLAENTSAWLAGNVYFGAWVNDNKVYFDISQNIQDKSQAIASGKNWNQLAIFDLSTFESITL